MVMVYTFNIAAENEHFQIVKYLIEQGEADPNIAIVMDIMHYISSKITKDTKVIEFY